MMCIVKKTVGKIFLAAVVISAFTFSSLDLHAQEQAAGQPAERKKTLSFEDELVEGSTQKPELFYLFQKKNFNYKRLIKLRENFLPEMRKTSEDLQRVRSSN
jgi:hypothetical protein